MSTLNPRLIGFLLLAIGSRRRVADKWIENNLFRHYRSCESFVHEEMNQRLYGDSFLPEEKLNVIHRHLLGMRDMGLIEYADEHEAFSRPVLSRWRLKATVENGEVRGQGGSHDGNRNNGGRNSGGGGGGDGNRNTGGDGQDGSNDGQGGIREVLGHPTLFALPKPEFDSWIDGLFEGENA